MWPSPQETTDLVTFVEEILNGKLHLLCTETSDFLNVNLHIFPISRRDISANTSFIFQMVE